MECCVMPSQSGKEKKGDGDGVEEIRRLKAVGLQ